MSTASTSMIHRTVSNSNSKETNGAAADMEHQKEPLVAKDSEEKPKSARSPPFYLNPGLIFMALLALQVGTQPILSRKCTNKDVIITTNVIACEVTKVVCSLVIIFLEGKGGQLVKQWTLVGGLVSSGIPAAIYALQNTLIQMAYRHLDYLTFNMLNQTKLLFTALFNFVIMGNKQSPRQVLALFGMLAAATLLTVSGKSGSKSSSEGEHDESFWLGIVPVLAASMTSGVASTLCQWVVQVQGRSTYLMTIEMSLIGTAVLLASMMHSADGARIRELGFFHEWTPLTTIPIITNAAGGILVGLVTKYAGGVKKGFVVISALLVTAVTQYLVDGTKPSTFVWIALPIVVGSTYMHSQNPYVGKVKKSV